MVTAFSIIQFIVATALILVVTFQSGKGAGLSSLFGGSDTYLAKNQAKSLDAKLSKITTLIAIAFVVLSLVLTFLAF